MKIMNSTGGIHSIVYALKVLFKVGFKRSFSTLFSKNTCKTCAFGMGGQKGGMKNELGRFPEICKKSLQAMESDKNGPIPTSLFKRYSIEELGSLGPRRLEKLGRIDTPLYATGEDNYLRPISWSEANQKIIAKMKATDPKRSFFYFSGRSSNEAGFLLQLLARQYGTNHVNNCSYYCHQASGVGLTQSFGTGTATVTLEDVEHSDLFVLIGANPTSNHPRLLTTLVELKKRGGKVIVVNPVKEPGLVKFHLPSSLKSLLFGSDIADMYLCPNIGGDLAFLYGVGKYLIENEQIDQNFIDRYTDGFDEFKQLVTNLNWAEIVQRSGLSKEQIIQFSELYSKSQNAIFSWAMGITHHIHGVDNVRAISNIALLKGMVGRKNAGLLPLRGHSNVQGMGTIGATPKLKKDIFDHLTSIGIELPTFEGMDTLSCMEASMAGEVDFSLCLGGNLYASNPDLGFASRAMNKIGMITYLSTTLNEGHFLARGKELLILPVLARDEEGQATTQESMFNFIRMSDGGPHRLKMAKSETEIIANFGENLFAARPIDWSKLKGHEEIRSLIAKAIPELEELALIDKTKKEFAIEQRIYHTPFFNTPNKKAQFSSASLPDIDNADDTLTLMTIRSEGQFNTVVYEEEDRWRGIKERNVILLNRVDMDRLNLKQEDLVSVESSIARMDRIKVIEFDIKSGNALMYFPEANILVPRSIDPKSKTPAYKAVPVKIFRDRNGNA